jgi:hypothetical protein
VYVSPALSDLLDRGSDLPRESFNTLPELTPPMRAQLLEEARQLAMLGYIDAAEQLLLESFHRFDLQPLTSYDLLTAMFAGLEGAGAAERVKHWQSQQRVLLGE